MPRCQQQGCPYQACYRGVPLAPTIPCFVCYHVLGILARSPGGESSGWSKTTANTGVGTPASVPGAVPPSSHAPCHPGAKGDHPSSPQTRLASGRLDAGCDGASWDTTHARARRTGLGTAARGTEGHRWEKPRSPGTSACSLPQQSRPMLAGSTVGPAPAGTSWKAASRAHIPRLSPTGMAATFPGCCDTQPRQPALGTVSRFPLPTRDANGLQPPEAKGDLSLPLPSPLGGFAARSPCGREPGPGAGCLGGRPSSSFPT